MLDPTEQATADQRAWLNWTRRSRLEPFKKLGTTIKDRFDAVVRGMTNHRSKAFVEAIRGLLQQAKRAARGFRKATNFIAIPYLRMSNLGGLTFELSVRYSARVELPVTVMLRDEEVFGVARRVLEADAFELYRRHGTEDHGEIGWISFSDDDGETRVVFRALHRDFERTLRLITADELRNGLRCARGAGVAKVFWGIDDAVARGECGA